MSLRSVKIFYWTLFWFALFILQLNVGIGLLGLAIVVLPVLVLHVMSGLKINELESSRPFLIVSAVNLTAFALVRPDGVHAFDDNGLSALLDIFGVTGGFSTEYKNYLHAISLVLLGIQLIIELKIKKRLISR